jgi:hypothetical protein
MEFPIRYVVLTYVCLILIPVGGISRPIPFPSPAKDPYPDPAEGGNPSKEYESEYYYADETTVAGIESGKRRESGLEAVAEFPQHFPKYEARGLGSSGPSSNILPPSPDYDMVRGSKKAGSPSVKSRPQADAIPTPVPPQYEYEYVYEDEFGNELGPATARFPDENTTLIYLSDDDGDPLGKNYLSPDEPPKLGLGSRRLVELLDMRATTKPGHPLNERENEIPNERFALENEEAWRSKPKNDEEVSGKIKSENGNPNGRFALENEDAWRSKQKINKEDLEEMKGENEVPNDRFALEHEDAWRLKSKTGKEVLGMLKSKNEIPNEHLVLENEEAWRSKRKNDEELLGKMKIESSTVQMSQDGRGMSGRGEQ